MRVLETGEWVYVIVWSHKHGEDLFILRSEQAPSVEDAVLLVESYGGQFEPELGEEIEIRSASVFEEVK